MRRLPAAMGAPSLRGIFAVKLPVTDLARSQAWYERVFELEPDTEFPDDDGVVRGVAGRLPGVADTTFALRESPRHANGVAGFNLLNLAVADKTDVRAWAARLDELGVELHLYSQERHGIGQAGRSGYGRPIIRPGATPTTTERT